MSKLVTVATFQFVAEADAMRCALEDEGIVAYLADDNLITMDWFMSNAVGGVKVQVAEKDSSTARAFVEAFDKKRSEKNPEEVRFQCESCGGNLAFPGKRRGGVETCNHCGEYVDVPD